MHWFFFAFIRANIRRTKRACFLPMIFMLFLNPDEFGYRWKLDSKFGWGVVAPKYEWSSHSFSFLTPSSLEVVIMENIVLDLGFLIYSWWECNLTLYTLLIKNSVWKKWNCTLFIAEEHLNYNFVCTWTTFVNPITFLASRIVVKARLQSYQGSWKY